MNSRAASKVSLKATAGLRQLPLHDQQQLMQHTRTSLSKSSFHFTPEDTRVLTGSEEALYDWMAVSFAFAGTRQHVLSSSLSSDNSGSSHAFFVDVFGSAGDGYLGSTDMGGSSKQITYTTALTTPSTTPSSGDSPPLGSNGKCTPDWVVKLPGDSHHHCDHRSEYYPYYQYYSISISYQYILPSPLTLLSIIYTYIHHGLSDCLSYMVYFAV
jgi:hypothetical protein